MLYYVMLEIAYGLLMGFIGLVRLCGFVWSLHLWTLCWVMSNGILWVVMLFSLVYML